MSFARLLRITKYHDCIEKWNARRDTRQIKTLQTSDVPKSWTWVLANVNECTYCIFSTLVAYLWSKQCFIFRLLTWNHCVLLFVRHTSRLCGHLNTYPRTGMCSCHSVEMAQSTSGNSKYISLSVYIRAVREMFKGWVMFSSSNYHIRSWCILLEACIGLALRYMSICVCGCVSCYVPSLSLS